MRPMPARMGSLQRRMVSPMSHLRRARRAIADASIHAPRRLRETDTTQAAGALSMTPLENMETDIRASVVRSVKPGCLNPFHAKCLLAAIDIVSALIQQGEAVCGCGDPNCIAS